MSVAFYIVLDNDEADFDTFVNGKALAHDTEGLDKISKLLGLPRLEEFVSMSAEDLEDLLGDDADIPEQDAQWFTADQGIAFVQAMAGHIRVNPTSVKNTEGVLDDLQEYADVFANAKAIGAKWHLNLDI